MELGELLIVIVVFYSIITFMRILSAHLLKRRIIKAGHLDRAEILGQDTDVKKEEDSYDRYPALKWGLVAFFGGLGFIIMELLGKSNPSFLDYRSTMPFGIFFVSISLGFLLYYFLMNRKAIR